jgi:hypothetical protein
MNKSTFKSFCHSAIVFSIAFFLIGINFSFKGCRSNSIKPVMEDAKIVYTTVWKFIGKNNQSSAIKAKAEIVIVEKELEKIISASNSAVITRSMDEIEKRLLIENASDEFKLFFKRFLPFITLGGAPKFSLEKYLDQHPSKGFSFDTSSSTLTFPVSHTFQGKKTEIFAKINLIGILEQHENIKKIGYVKQIESIERIDNENKPQPVVRVEPQPVVRVEPKPVVRVEPKPVVRVEPQPVVRVEPKPKIEPENEEKTTRCQHKIVCNHKIECSHTINCQHRIACQHTIDCQHRMACQHTDYCQHRIPCNHFYQSPYGLQTYHRFDFQHQFDYVHPFDVRHQFDYVHPFDVRHQFDYAHSFDNAHTYDLQHSFDYK